MIIQLKQSALDTKYLNQRTTMAAPVVADFLNLVVNKPWGQEYLIFNNGVVEVWHLSIKNLHSTSMHCHPNKKTSLVILSGQALFSSLNKSIQLNPLDGAVIDAGTFHSTQAISKNGITMLEFETPPMKHDLIRLEDKYGRVANGYEGIDAMVVGSNLYPRLNNEIGNDLVYKNMVFRLFDQKKLKSENKKSDLAGAINVVLGGRVTIKNNVFGVCDIFIAKASDNIKISGNSLIFCIGAAKK
jgi:mannose-6-phosphate isomerase-like protein (cupin superfamily)